jgi:hypothetical protein
MLDPFEAEELATEDEHIAKLQAMFVAELEEGSVERLEVFDLDGFVRGGEFGVSRRQHGVCGEGEVSLSSDNKFLERKWRGGSVGAIVAQLQEPESRQRRGAWHDGRNRRLLRQTAFSTEPGSRRVVGAATAAGEEVGFVGWVGLDDSASRVGRRGNVELGEEELRAMEIGAAGAPFVVIGLFEEEPEGLCEGVVVGGCHGRADRRGDALRLRIASKRGVRQVSADSS